MLLLSKMTIRRKIMMGRYNFPSYSIFYAFLCMCATKSHCGNVSPLICPSSVLMSDLDSQQRLNHFESNLVTLPLAVLVLFINILSLPCYKYRYFLSLQAPEVPFPSSSSYFFLPILFSRWKCYVFCFYRERTSQIVFYHFLMVRKVKVLLLSFFA